LCDNLALHIALRAPPLDFVIVYQRACPLILSAAPLAGKFNLFKPIFIMCEFHEGHFAVELVKTQKVYIPIRIRFNRAI
jgi:hypothetical protein